MSIETYYPASTSLLSETIGIVLLNHVGSCVSQDTGRDAQSLADATSMAVIAADRPGSGFCMPNPILERSLARDYVAGMVDLGKRIDKEASREGLGRLLVAGRSAGGTAALALTPAEVLRIDSVYAAEAIGFYDTSVRDGKRDYSRYAQQQKKLVDDTIEYPHLVRPHGTGLTKLANLGRVAAIAVCLPLDKYHNKNVWNNTGALRNAQYIAEEMPEISAQLDFAEHSMSLSAHHSLLDTLLEVFPERRQQTSNVPFCVEQVPNTVHASFDNRAFFAQRLQPLVERVLAR